MKAYCTYVLLFLLSIYHLHGQYSVQGQIKSYVGEPLADATIICRADGNKINSYAIADAKGMYHLDITSEGSYILTFSSLGFHTKLIPVQYDTGINDTTLLDVVLNRNYIILDEVILAENRPILIRKDTIVFDAKYFKRGNEQDVEDLLKNIPNINVDTDGTIRVGDTEIEKIMIEGDDFFNKGYKMISRNMPSNPIHKVEIIKNYTKNALLKGINNSDKIALNLKLVETAKHIWFGNFEAGYGLSSQSRYETSAILMNFGKTNKYYFLGDLNNSGIDSKGIFNSILSPLDLESTRNIGDDEHAFRLVQRGQMPGSFKKRRTNFNNSEIISLNTIFNPGDSLKIKANGFLNWDGNQFFANSSSFVGVAGSNFTNSQIFQLNSTENTGFAKLDFTLNIRASELLEGSFGYQHKNEIDVSDLIFNSVATAENLTSDFTQLDVTVDYSNRMKKDMAFLLKARYRYEDAPQEYSANQFYYSELFPEFSVANNIAQRSNNVMKFAGIEGRLLNKTRKGDLWQVQFGNTYRNDRLKSVFSLKEDDLILGQPAAFQNNLIFITNDLRLISKYSYKTDKLVLTGELGLHQIFNTSISNNNSKNHNPFYINPKLGAVWAPDDINELKAIYSYNTTNSSVTDAYSNYSITGFRSFYRGMGSFNQLDASRLLLTYRLGNWSENFFLDTSVLYVKNHDFFSSNSIVNQNFTLSERMIIDDRELFNMATNMDFFIKPITSNIKLNLGLSKITYKNEVNNSDLREIISQKFDYGVQLRSGFEGKLNFHLGTKWIENRITTTFQNKFKDNITFADLTFVFNDQINLDVQTERYFFGNLDKDNNTYYFLDFNLRYTRNKRISFSISGNNVFNTNRFRMYSTSDLGNSTTEYRLLPRFIMLKLKYRFGVK